VPISSNETGGIIRVRGTINQQKTGMATAEAECKKYDRLAHYEGINELRGTLRYACVSRQQD
jgi:hypothetical protein